MTTVTLQDIKRHGAKSISGEEPVYLIVNSKPFKVMLEPAYFEEIMEMLEEMEDRKFVLERESEETISHEEMLNKLDLK